MIQTKSSCEFLCPVFPIFDTSGKMIQETKGKKKPSKALVVVQSLSSVHLFATPWSAAFQSFLSFTVSWSLLKLMSTELVMLSNLLSILSSVTLFSCCQSFPASVFSSESALRIRWPKYWSSRSIKFTTHPESLKFRRPLDINFMPSAVDQRNTDQKSQLFPPPSSPKTS